MTFFLERVIDQFTNPGDRIASARALDTTFQPSATKWTVVIYTIQLVCTATQSASVELRSDAASPPTTVHASATFTLAAAAVSTTVRQTIWTLVKPGDNVRLVSAGTGTPTIAHQSEFTLA